MILESVVLDVIAGQEGEFEQAFAKASPRIASAKGYLGHAIRRCVERPSRYLLAVKWRTLEDHTVGFRASPQYQEWKRLLHHFYDPFPVVEHFVALPSAVTPPAGPVKPSEHEGGCHCGRVRFRVRGDLSHVTECNCSICVKKGYLHVIVPRDQFELLSGEDALTTYRFNTGVAAHRFCEDCGVQSFYVPRSDPDKIDVNARCLDGIDSSKLKVAPFDGSHREQAMTEPIPRRDG
jgi:heme-degrading monooxygenase HmoA